MHTNLTQVCATPSHRQYLHTWYVHLWLWMCWIGDLQITHLHIYGYSGLYLVHHEVVTKHLYTRMFLYVMQVMYAFADDTFMKCNVLYGIRNNF